MYFLLTLANYVIVKLVRQTGYVVKLNHYLLFLYFCLHKFHFEQCYYVCTQNNIKKNFDLSTKWVRKVNLFIELKLKTKRTVLTQYEDDCLSLVS